MKKKIMSIITSGFLLMSLVFGSFGSAFALDIQKIEPIVADDPGYLVNIDSFPEVTKAIKEIKDPIRQDLIIKNLFTPTSIEYKVVDTRTYKDSSEENNRKAVPELLSKVDELENMQIAELKAQAAKIEAKGEEVMKEFTQPIDYNLLRSSEIARATSVNSYWKSFVKQAKAGSLVLLDFEVQMDWQSNGSNIVYVAPSSFGNSYTPFWTAYKISQQNPVVNGGYATLSNKECRFCSVSNGYINTAESFYITMPTLRVNANGTYSPTSIPSIPGPM